MNRMKKYKKVIAMSAAALAMTAALTVQSSMAYFTTYVSAGGGGEVSLKVQTEIHEDPVTDMTKHITIKNVEANDCFVRVKAFYGGLISIEYRNADGGNDWYDGGDGYWYYRPVLKAGATSSQLDIKINVPEGFDKDTFNVVVVQECTPVIYDDNGNPGAEWDTVYSDYQRGGNN